MPRCGPCTTCASYGRASARASRACARKPRRAATTPAPEAAARNTRSATARAEARPFAFRRAARSVGHEARFEALRIVGQLERHQLAVLAVRDAVGGEQAPLALGVVAGRVDQ